LPFEPEAYVRLGGPRCIYVGHPLIERLAELHPSEGEARRRIGLPPIVVVAPGSRRSEISRLMSDFGAALDGLKAAVGPVTAVLPTLPHVEAEVRARAAHWRQPPTIVLGEAEKFAAFRSARAALAASGTVTLELALSGVPTVGAYKVSRVEEQLKYLIKVPSILLPNLILGERAIPEYLQRDCTPAALGLALAEVVRDGPARTAQIEALKRLDGLMRLSDGSAPSARAAQAVLETIAEGQHKPHVYE
jgi:lipid-A-disaccharide synthase